MGRIERLEARLAEIDRELADPELYARAAQEKAATLAQERAKAAAEMERLMAEWEELETEAG